MFRCRHTNNFIKYQYLCDNQIDCQYGDDEDFCNLKNTTICPHSQCICLHPFELICHNSITISEESLNLRTINSLKSFFFNKSYKYFYLTYLNISKNIHFNFMTEKNFPNLIYLDLNYNNLNKKEKFEFNFKKLTNLYLKSTNLLKIPLLNLKNLIYLDISENKFDYLTKNSFKFLFNLTELIAINLNIKSIHSSSFGSINNLNILHLNNTLIKSSINHEFILKLSKLNKIFTEEYSICCIFKEFGKNYRDCIHFRQTYSSCTTLLISHVLRSILWIYVVFGLFGNVLAIFLRLKKSSKEILFIYLLLHLADTGIIVYLIIMGVYDLMTIGVYMEKDSDWRYSKTCTSLGVLMSYSTVLSIFSLLSITFERFTKIFFPFYNFFRIYKLFIICSIVLLIPLIIATLPLLLFNVRNNIKNRPIKNVIFEFKSFNFSFNFIRNRTFIQDLQCVSHCI